MASHQAARRAVELGFTRVFVMTDGIDGWAAAGHPVEKG
jgi:rhodanese-related sulfurtransferase